MTEQQILEYFEKYEGWTEEQLIDRLREKGVKGIQDEASSCSLVNLFWGELADIDRADKIFVNLAGTQV